MAAVRLLLGCVGALLCVAGACFGYPSGSSCIATSEPSVLAERDDRARASGAEQRESRGVSLKSALSNTLKSATGAGKVVSATAGGLSNEKSPPEEVASSVTSHQATSIEAQQTVSVAERSDEREKTEPSVGRSPSQTPFVGSQATSNVLFLLSDLYERFADACVRVRYKLDGKAQVASGFFVSDKGHVLTPVVGGKEFYVETRSNWRLSARRCGEDAVTSLCLLRVDAKEWQAYQEEINERLKDNPALKARRRYFSLLRNDEWPKIGQPIVGLSCRLGGAVSPQIGYVTAFQERYFATEFPFVFVRSSLRIDAGDCGGAVLDVRGNLLGMLFHALPDTQETFYMPSQALERVFRDLLLFGNVRYSYAGLSVQSMYDPKTHAVCLQVQVVQPNSPAAQSGFKVNDVLLRVNDTEISSIEMFKNFIFLSKPGDVLQCTVMRGKKTLNLTLILAEKP